jgi:serine/threonine protein kinase/Tfp pilus assembly protein PilF
MKTSEKPSLTSWFPSVLTGSRQSRQPALEAPSRTAAINPEVAAEESLLLDRAYEEYCRRVEAGETIDTQVFCQQYPALRSLRKLLEAHQFLEENPEVLPTELPEGWPKPGQTFKGFALLRELGRGAFARVFLAVEPALGERLVVVKVSLLGTEEADTQARLSHPNIVPVYSVQTDASTNMTVICMPYLGSATLDAVLDRIGPGPRLPRQAQVILDAARPAGLPDTLAGHHRQAAFLTGKRNYVDAVLEMGVQMARALDFVHEQKICHRDLKPSNVLLSPDGRPMLLDFNLSSDQRTADAHLAGTLPYMAPEQLEVASGDNPHATGTPMPAADLFSLGVILYELVAGVHPFGPIPSRMAMKELGQLLLERQRRGAPSLQKANPSVDTALARIIERCLAVKAADRPPSAADLARDLRKALSPLGCAGRWLRTHPRSAAMSAACVIVAVLGSAYGYSIQDPYSVKQYRLGLQAYGQGEYQQAVEYFDNAAKADPHSPWIFFARGRAFQQIGNDQALEWALRSYSLADSQVKNGKVKACMAYCENHIGRPDLATFWYKQALDAEFRTAEVHNNLGWTLLLQGPQYQIGALEHLDQAISLNPDLPAAYHNRAIYQLRLPSDKRDLQKGLGDIETAIDKAKGQGSVPPQMYLDGIHLCLQVHNKGLGDRTDQMFGFFEEALKEGVSAGDLVKSIKDGLQGLDRKRYQELLAHNASNARPYPKAVHFLDPVQGIPQN